MLSRVLAFTLVVLTCCVTALSQTTAPLIHVLMINDQSVPLKIIAVNSGTSNLLASVAIQNNSSKSIISYRIGWITTVAAQCADQRASGVEHSLTGESEQRLEVGETAVLHPSRIDPAPIVAFGRGHHAAVSSIQLAVTEVGFEDGTSWTRIKDSDVYSQKELEREASGMCANGKLLETISECPGSSKIRSVLKSAVMDSSDGAFSQPASFKSTK